MVPEMVRELSWKLVVIRCALAEISLLSFSHLISSLSTCQHASTGFPLTSRPASPLRQDYRLLFHRGFYHWRELAQNFCRDKNDPVFCRDKNDPVFCRDKNDPVFCRDKSMLVATKLLPRQARVCRDRHNLVAASILLSRQKTCLSRQNALSFKPLLSDRIPTDL